MRKSTATKLFIALTLLFQFIAFIFYGLNLSRHENNQEVLGESTNSITEKPDISLFDIGN
jgi:hypothetical protein